MLLPLLMNNLLSEAGEPEPEVPVVVRDQSAGSGSWWEGEWIIPGVTHYLPEKPPEDITPLRPKIDEAKERLKKAKPPKVDTEYRKLTGRLTALSRAAEKLERRASQVIEARATEEAIAGAIERYRELAGRQERIEADIAVMEAREAHRQRVAEDDEQVIRMILKLLDEDDERREIKRLRVF